MPKRNGGGAADAVPSPPRDAAQREAPRLRESLEREVEAIGLEWAEARIHAFVTEGRPIAGGWPGTLSEARTRVDASAGARGGDSDREAMARRTYMVAKARWLSRAAHEPDDRQD
ncbi:MAG: hypothetical protein U0263_06555 [Polyangiaceae bacterium]